MVPTRSRPVIAGDSSPPARDIRRTAALRTVVIECPTWAVPEWSPDAGNRVTGPV
jgi:hypothetical protein